MSQAAVRRQSHVRLQANPDAAQVFIHADPEVGDEEQDHRERGHEAGGECAVSLKHASLSVDVFPNEVLRRGYERCPTAVLLAQQPCDANERRLSSGTCALPLA